jgi:hypothetical protein
MSSMHLQPHPRERRMPSVMLSALLFSLVITCALALVG